MKKKKMREISKEMGKGEKEKEKRLERINGSKSRGLWSTCEAFFVYIGWVSFSMCDGVGD